MNKILYHPKEGTTGFFYGDFPVKDWICTDTSSCTQVIGCNCKDFELYLKLAKEEAIKNGEIVNPELLYPSGLESLFIPQMLTSGDIFDLPEGVYSEKCRKKQSSRIFKTVIRLVPIKEEKNQHYLQTRKKGIMKKAAWLKSCLDNGWSKEELDDLDKLWDKYKDEAGNLKEPIKESQNDLLLSLIDMLDRTNEDVLKHFTIQRKSK